MVEFAQDDGADLCTPRWHRMGFMRQSCIWRVQVLISKSLQRLGAR
jgi:hypothetical protein